jgi:hypothetical protein
LSAVEGAAAGSLKADAMPILGLLEYLKMPASDVGNAHVYIGGKA